MISSQRLRCGLRGVLLSAAVSFLPMTAQAVQLADGTVYFNQVPRLVETSVNFDDVRIPRTKYDFRISLPADAQEPLKTVTFAQHEGFDAIAFRLQDTQAFRGKNRKQPIVIESVSENEAGAIIVTLADPLAPGADMTIRLRARYNPDTGGVYLFGVTAFPEGAKAHGQFLGFGRFHIYDSDHGSS